MDRRKRLLVCLAGLSICMGFLLTEEITVQAGEKEGHDFMCSGVGTVLDPNDFTVDEPEKQQEELNIYQKFEAEQARMETELAMANVQNALNVRAQANEKSEKVGFLYKDCGGTILEQENGWTKIKSGNVIGWAKDEYLVFGEDAEKMAEDVGNWIVKLNSEAVRVRMEPNEEAETICYLAKDDAVDFIEIVNDEWVSICSISSGVFPSSRTFVTVENSARFFSSCPITASSVKGISWMINPPACFTVLSFSIRTPSPTLDGTCSDVAK